MMHSQKNIKKTTV